MFVERASKGFKDDTHEGSKSPSFAHIDHINKFINFFEVKLIGDTRHEFQDGFKQRALLDMGSKINHSVNKLIKLEEIYVREKLQRDEWKRKARVCDAICCLLVFFLLMICSLFIFVILPTVKTASLID